MKTEPYPDRIHAYSVLCVGQVRVRDVVAWCAGGGHPTTGMATTMLDGTMLHDVDDASAVGKKRIGKLDLRCECIGTAPDLLCSSSRLTHKAHATRATADRTGHSHTGRGRGGDRRQRDRDGRILAAYCSSTVQYCRSTHKAHATRPGHRRQTWALQERRGRGASRG